NGGGLITDTTTNPKVHRKLTFSNPSVAPVAILLDPTLTVGMPSRLDVRKVFSDDHGNWRYDTVIAFAQDDAGIHAANHETSGVEWVALHLVSSYQLHPGLATHWMTIAELVRKELAV
ncbi:MAG: hypothetical protein ACKOIZ_12965, partial [Actinomycetota bacterium]